MADKKIKNSLDEKNILGIVAFQILRQLIA